MQVGFKNRENDRRRDSLEVRMGMGLANRNIIAENDDDRLPLEPSDPLARVSQEDFDAMRRLFRTGHDTDPDAALRDLNSLTHEAKNTPEFEQAYQRTQKIIGDALQRDIAVYNGQMDRLADDVVAAAAFAVVRNNPDIEPQDFVRSVRAEVTVQMARVGNVPVSPLLATASNDHASVSIPEVRGLTAETTLHKEVQKDLRTLEAHSDQALQIARKQSGYADDHDDTNDNHLAGPVVAAGVVVAFAPRGPNRAALKLQEAKMRPSNDDQAKKKKQAEAEAEAEAKRSDKWYRLLFVGGAAVLLSNEP